MVLARTSFFLWTFSVTVLLVMPDEYKSTATLLKFTENTDIEDIIAGKNNFKSMVWDPTGKTSDVFSITDGYPLHIILSRKKKGHCEMFYMKFTDLTIMEMNNSRRMIVCVAELKDHRLTEECHWINNTDNLIINQGNLYGMPKDCGPWYLTVYVTSDSTAGSSQPNSITNSTTTDISVEVSGPYDPLSFRWFRVITNIAFIPGILIAFIRGFYAECIVYFMNFTLSWTYHLCEAELHCFKDYDRLHISDVYCSDLSIIVTVWVMTGIKAPLKHIIYLTIAIMLQFAVTETYANEYQFYVNLVFAGLPACYLFYRYVIQSIKYRRCHLGYKRWLFHLIPGFCLAATGAVVNMIISGSENYYYVHCIWHVTIMLSVAFLLPHKEDEDEDNKWYHSVGGIHDKHTYTPL